MHWPIKKIVFVTNRYFPNLVGGAELTVQTLAEELLRRGMDVVVISLSSTAVPSQDEVNGIRVHRIVVSNLYVPFGAAQPAIRKLLWHLRDIHNSDSAKILGRLLDIERPDVVSTHNLGGIGVAIWRQVRLRGIRLVHTLHDYYALCPRVTMFKNGINCARQCTSCFAFSLLKRSASRQVEILIGISRFVLDAHIRRGFFPNAKHAVIYNSRLSSGQLLASHAGNPESKSLRFGFIGRIEPEKGIELLLSALSTIAPTSWTLRIAGRAPDQTYLERLRRKFPLPQIEYVGFVQPASFYPTIDVLVVPSIWNEPLGVVAFESMGYGVPVVASTSGGLPEILEGSGAGWLFDAGNEASLSRVLSEAIATRAQLPRMRAACFMRRQHFMPQRHADEFLAAIGRDSSVPPQ
jgi:glycosyltransferase involved in cell wall biosynthesis